MEQLYVVLVNLTLQQELWDASWQEQNPGASESEREWHRLAAAQVAERRKAFADKTVTPLFEYHSGGRGNGAQGGLYTSKQLARILGRYQEGVAEALPVAVGLTQEASDSNAEDSHFLSCLQAQGVDNWSGYEFAQEAFAEENGDGE